MLLKAVFRLGLFCFICDFYRAQQTTGADPVIETPLGKLQGKILKTVKGNDFYAFRGIPYAKPPIKELRFEPPEPIEKWNGIHDATEDGHACIQMDIMRKNLLTGDEDCLYLNVYSTQLASTDPRPVMVFIHGGGFISGTGRSDLYGPERLLDKDIVLVTINYRLSVIGFLSTGDSVVAGNNGLRDQVLALKWVRDNVAAFGGDPERVTIFGESAGSAAVTFHLLSPQSQGLFHAAIAQSGSANCPWSILSADVVAKRTQLLAQKLNCPTDSSQAMVRCLRRKAALDLVVQSSTNDLTTMLVFMPVIERRGHEAFIADYPQSLFDSNQITRVPVMMGNDRDEGFLLLQIYSATKGGIEHFKIEHLKAVTDNFQIENTNFNVNKYQRRIEEISQLDPENHLQRIDAISKVDRRVARIIADVFINVGVDKTLSSLAANGIPTYAYKNIYKGQHTFAKLLPPNEIDYVYADQLNVVTHADELPFLFKTRFVNEAELNENDTRMSEIFLTLWTNFATTGVPSLDGNDSTFQWTPVQPDRPQYLNLNLEPYMENGVLSDDPELMAPNDLREEL